MRALPPALAASLAAGVTTLARAWAVTRRDGVTLGFTDHDRPLAFDGIAFEAASGLTASTVEQGLGLAPDSHTVEGALQSAAIRDIDLEAGLYDGAEIRLWLVDWQDPASRVLLSRGQIGEIRRGSHAFEAEVLGLAERLNQPHGRAWLTGCDARLGDARCGVDLEQPAYRGSGSVTAVIAPETVEVAGLEGFASRWFDRGRLAWSSGANAAQPGRVKLHRAAGAVRVTLWAAPAAPIQPGDAFEIRAGCDKAAATCREKFANLMNFRGFPFMPGDDWTTTYPNSGEAHDGGSLFRG
ncbi:DUF2163 domain-containing protein [Paralimibaculum aggregatum]|uniref:DUF2163 domain-containing protein n=1 Tax=Paralimibaculum aggregatum TaxID=3036245 RepID=A0ABQ6LKQ7_9RHOB|nr:DUF2163 domain-containing protein [Limibaculum sp. NKW23]GMG81239.1 DUF2163 domain-containing protein [Limibaculum sp. NKW23]